MTQTLGLVAIVVREYDEAIAWYTTNLGFELVEDTPQSAVKRWVRVRPPGSNGTDLLLARAANAEQASRVGNQSGGRVFLFLYTDDFYRDYEAYRARGVVFIRPPSDEPDGTVAVFEDLYGNKWDLVQMKQDSAGL